MSDQQTRATGRQGKVVVIGEYKPTCAQSAGINPNRFLRHLANDLGHVIEAGLMSLFQRAPMVSSFSELAAAVEQKVPKGELLSELHIGGVIRGGLIGGSVFLIGEDVLCPETASKLGYFLNSRLQHRISPNLSIKLFNTDMTRASLSMQQDRSIARQLSIWCDVRVTVSSQVWRPNLEGVAARQ